LPLLTWRQPKRVQQGIDLTCIVKVKHGLDPALVLPLTDERLVRLAILAELLRDHDAASLARLRQRDGMLEAARRKLAQSAADPGAATPFQRAGLQGTHERWAAAEKRRINLERAQLRAEEEGLRRTAARSSARAEILRRLAAKPKRPR